MTQTMLERIFQEKPIPAKREQRRPSTVFEQNLDDWVRLRGNDLYDRPQGSYAYFMPEVQRKLDATSGVFKRSERTRADIREGADADDFITDAENAPPGRYMEMIATWFGWRLIPLARKFAEESGQQDFAFQAEKSVRSWLAKADVVWESLETMPESRKNRESFEVWVQPLRAEAYRITDAVNEWIDRNS
jgi:hypothetical protein